MAAVFVGVSKQEILVLFDLWEQAESQGVPVVGGLVPPVPVPAGVVAVVNGGGGVTVGGVVVGAVVVVGVVPAAC